MAESAALVIHSGSRSKPPCKLLFGNRNENYNSTTNGRHSLYWMCSVASKVARPRDNENGKNHLVLLLGDVLGNSAGFALGFCVQEAVLPLVFGFLGLSLLLAPMYIYC